MAIRSGNGDAVLLRYIQIQRDAGINACICSIGQGITGSAAADYGGHGVQFGDAGDGGVTQVPGAVKVKRGNGVRSVVYKAVYHEVVVGGCYGRRVIGLAAGGQAGGQQQNEKVYMVFDGWHRSKLDRIGDKWDLRSEYRQLVSFDHSIFLCKIYGIGILPSGQVVYAEGPEVMSSLSDLMIALDNERKVRSEIIGYPVCIPF